MKGYIESKHNDESLGTRAEASLLFETDQRPLITKTDRATCGFLKFDLRHRA